ncbi:hypothetical protein L1887_44476 [Cichorium endivia]|nr:hypothetical protein L1887_44476 [Cichorium endivia]
MPVRMVVARNVAGDVYQSPSSAHTTTHNTIHLLLSHLGQPSNNKLSYCACTPTSSWVRPTTTSHWARHTTTTNPTFRDLNPTQAYMAFTNPSPNYYPFELVQFTHALAVNTFYDDWYMDSSATSHMTDSQGNLFPYFKQAMHINRAESEKNTQG